MRIGEHRIGICDDAWKDLQKIEAALSEAVEILGEQKISLHLYTDPHKMREEDHKKKFDLVFLDLEMPEVHGFELAKWLYMQNPEVKLVFVSHYENMVFDTYDYMPLWFVRKSCLAHDVLKALRKYFSMTTKIQVRHKISKGFSTSNLRLEDVMYAECNGHTITLIMFDHTVFRLHGTLKALEEAWKDHHFIRIHKNYLVNCRYIAEVTARNVRLFDETELDIGKNRRKEIAELVNRQKERLCLYYRTYH